ncbi:hypothetical protein H6G33_12245 [Calothrix sp. FACHB-1219]|uniref:hypothetical protein n=1 Tax=unclassified Calothrix TaxID=2619626 RepID=UPI001684A88B|nr:MULTISPECIES: hypothetical protein [unclassified Calothrix]MBD2202607.1 hypothetical protein [Calothrix sp. FACHB-168]MBD2217803.1 hypothetical protein [Calothrix sp. FACHB-1219]
MNLYKISCSIGLALTISCGGLGLGLSTPAIAQRLVNPGAKNDSWRPIKIMVFNHLVQDFKKNNIRLSRNAKIEVSSLIISGDWLVTSYLIVSRENPNGWAGQLLFKNEGNRWVFKGDGNYIRDVNTLMNFGVPRQEAETLANGPDV